ncbi:MAG TPA: NAD(P)H-binding protein, partial [Ktedonobacterales bacterium]|nr:NAD(P)H-binding protein [Ktedonobacterales bacterium]
MDNIRDEEDGGSTARRVLVVGATGYLGSHIVTHLRQAGYPVRALARDPQRLAEERARGVEVFGGQVTRPETLDGLCDGVSVVVSTLGVRSLARKPTPWEVDYQGNLNVLTRARQAGVGHFIFAGVLHGDEVRSRIPVLEPRERFVDALRQSGI